LIFLRRREFNRLTRAISGEQPGEGGFLGRKCLRWKKEKGKGPRTPLDQAKRKAARQS